MFSIGQLASRSGVNVPTLRYYEQIGLIEKPHRSDGNQRRYEPSSLERVKFIRHGRELGFSIDSIRQLIELSKSPDMPCEKAHKIARTQLRTIQHKLERLQKLRIEMTRIANLCDQNNIGHCKVLEALADHSGCLTDHEG